MMDLYSFAEPFSQSLFSSNRLLEPRAPRGSRAKSQHRSSSAPGSECTPQWLLSFYEDASADLTEDALLSWLDGDLTDLDADSADRPPNAIAVTEVPPCQHVSPWHYLELMFQAPA